MTPITDIDEQTRNEENTKLNYITPEIQKKWSAEGEQIIMEYGKTNNVYFTDGQIIVGSDGNVTRGERKKVDYLLLYKYNLPLALVEAKGLNHDVCEGVSQAIEYARLLDVPFAYASNGKCFHEEDLLLGTNREFAMNEFPTSQELWERYRKANEITDEQSSMIAVPYYQGADGRKPRYYQRNAINRCIDRIAKAASFSYGNRNWKNFCCYADYLPTLRSRHKNRQLKLQLPDNENARPSARLCNHPRTSPPQRIKPQFKILGNRCRILPMV